MIIKVKCVCGRKIDVNPAKLLAEYSYRGKTKEEKRARTAKATEARKKLYTAKYKE